MVRSKTVIVGAVALATALLTAAAFARTTAVASVVVDQTCSARVAPRAQSSVSAAVRNDGDEVVQQVRVDGDAGTPENQADDFQLARTGNGNGNELLEPGETWTFGGSYRVGDGDTTHVVVVEATSLDGDPVSDLEGCVTDVIEPPVPGVRAGVAKVRGTVRFRLPGSNKFVELNGQTEIPMGAQVDTRNGAVRLISGVGGGGTESAEFFDGLFTIRQKRAPRSVMTLILGGGNFGVCRGGGSSTQSVGARPRKPVRRLWGSGKGRFETRARYSSATVRGTRWLTQDRCDGTLTRVAQGVVSVRDLVRRQTRLVKAGQSYLARAPGS